MTVWQLTLIVAAAGAIGGAVAAIISEDRGFFLPTRVTEATGVVFRPGFLGLIVVGAVAAALSWALYGPFVDATAFGGPDPLPGAELNDQYGITLGALGGAVLVGIGGSKWLSSQVDKVLLQQAASTAAEGNQDQGKATEIANSQPMEALKIAQTLQVAAK